jgi:hypothetical protein
VNRTIHAITALLVAGLISCGGNKGQKAQLGTELDKLCNQAKLGSELDKFCNLSTQVDVQCDNLRARARLILKMDDHQVVAAAFETAQWMSLCPGLEAQAKVIVDSRRLGDDQFARICRQALEELGTD